MSTPQANLEMQQQVTPQSFADQPLTPPLPDKKPFTVAPSVLALWRQLQAHKDVGEDPWIEFQLAEGEYDQIQSELQQDDELSGFVADKIRYNYDGEKRRLVVRMPTRAHEIVIRQVEGDILKQLEKLRAGQDRKARFAQKVDSHDDAVYPGIVIEVAYSQRKDALDQLAKVYLLDSDTNIQVVVGIITPYRKDPPNATLSIWRPDISQTPNGPVIHVVKVEEAFRDDNRNPVGNGLRLRLRDFAYDELADKDMGNEDEGIDISGTKLCQYLNAAESAAKRPRQRKYLPSNATKRGRSPIPPEELRPSDEAKQAEKEERAEALADRDGDYEDEE
ncbi:hypothetical protein CC80DRAFT_573058 [Byssothecium circinans]|uniref:Uncharacterized protein n=1 Tax=Byssothecium circinans TaxID=147558 RepID=A0A6A5TI17_9PLEO|nr:hypothetical protein CC80DRAFT_573058 [Byssothecium circinans]